MVMIDIVEDPSKINSPTANFTWSDRESWSAFGLCVGLSERAAKIFFPERGENTKQAKKICERCPVRTQCLEYALRNREPFGIWGGYTERERKRLRKAGA